MSQDGKLNQESTNRVELAIDHFAEGAAPFLITCGWDYRKDSTIAISQALADYAIESGKVTSHSILRANQSRDTVGDAFYSKQIANSQKGWSDFLIVTSDYHVNRTREIFQFVFGPRYKTDVIGSITEPNDQQKSGEVNSLSAFRKTFKGIQPGDDESIYRRLCEDHPFYNGDIHPKI